MFVAVIISRTTLPISTMVLVIKHVGYVNSFEACSSGIAWPPFALIVASIQTTHV